MNSYNIIIHQNVENKPILASIGTFDGMHLGHQKLLSKAKNYAKVHNYQFLVITFNPCPKTFLSQSKYIYSISEKIILLKQIQVDEILVINYDDVARNTSYLKFHEFLQSLNISKIFTGIDFRYGYLGQGSIQTLSKDFEVEIISYQNDSNHQKISSSNIKRCLALNNDIGQINTFFLKYPYFLYTLIVKGNQLSTKLGFPTINLLIEPNKIIPKNGVYYGNCKFDFLDKKFLAIINVGVSPTNFPNNKIIRVEAHILDFNINVYNKYVNLEFIEFIRAEKKFHSVDELKIQIINDIDFIRNKYK